jgi:hypothetical protein
MKSLQSELNYIKTELARDGRSLDFLCEIIDLENAIKRGESDESIRGLVDSLKHQRVISTNGLIR